VKIGSQSPNMEYAFQNRYGRVIYIDREFCVEEEKYTLKSNIGQKWNLGPRISSKNAYLFCFSNTRITLKKYFSCSAEFF
jgi:hypothetical protein